MRIVAERRVSRLAAAAESHARILPDHAPLGVRHLYLTSDEKRSVANSACSDVFRNRFGDAIAANVMQSSCGTLEHCLGNRVGVCGIDVDPRAASRIEYARKGLDAVRSVNAA